MPRPLRYIPPGSVVEVTIRTFQSRFLLLPSPELNDVVLGVLGRALDRHQVRLHAFSALSNHVHYLVTPADANELARFMHYVNVNLSKEVGRLHHWSGPMWARRYRAIVVANKRAQVARLAYVLRQGCKEGLVARPEDWPGATSVRGLVHGEPLFGTWLDRTAMHEARRAGEDVDRRDFEITYPIDLAPLPCWAGLSAAEHRQACAELVAEIERETAERDARLGRRPVNLDVLLDKDPHHVPERSHRSPAPSVHASTSAIRRRFKAAYRRFANAYRTAAELWRSGVRTVAFPVESFPPAPPFVRRA